MATLALRQCLILEIQKTFQKYDPIYNRVDLCQIEKSIMSGSYQLSFFWIKSQYRGFPFKMDSLCFYRFETLVDQECSLFEKDYYLCVKLEDEIILISLANVLQKYVLTPSVFLENSHSPAGQIRDYASFWLR